MGACAVENAWVMELKNSVCRGSAESLTSPFVF